MDPISLMLISSVLSTILGSGSSLMLRNYEQSQQENMLDKQQDFVRERENISFERQRPQQVLQDLIDAGINPNIAAQGVVGGASETAALGGSPSAPVVPSAIDSLKTMFAQGGQNLFDMFKQNAEIQNLQANTNKTDIEAGILPRDYWIRRQTADAMIKNYNASADEACSRAKLNEQETNLVKQQAMYYGRETEAKIETYKSQVLQAVANASKAFAEAETEAHKQQNIDADTLLKGVQASNVIQDTSNKIIEGVLTFEQSERERIAKEFEKSLNGIPLTADAQKMVSKWASDGQFDKIKDFYLTIFSSALNQSLGEYGGSAHPTFHMRPPFLPNQWGFGNPAPVFWNPYNNQ